VVYATARRTTRWPKALRIAGLGEAPVRRCGERTLRMRADALAAAIAADVRPDFGPG